MTEKREGFLIGASLLYPADEIRRRVHQGYHEAGFTDLNPTHDPIFGLLRPQGDRVVDLAKRAHTSKQAMGYLVAYLEDHGYLERIPDAEDARAKIVRRTEKGWEVNRLARKLVQQLQDEWSDALGKERMELLLELLGELVEHIGINYSGSVSEISSRNE